MNSLPPISHHLFVAAISNEGRVHEKPEQQEEPFAKVAHGAAANALAQADETMPFPWRGASPLRAPVHQARA